MMLPDENDFLSDCASHVSRGGKVVLLPCPWERIANVLLSHDDRAGRLKRVFSLGTMVRYVNVMKLSSVNLNI